MLVYGVTSLFLGGVGVLWWHRTKLLLLSTEVFSSVLNLISKYHQLIPEAQLVAGNVYVVPYRYQGRQYKLFFPVGSSFREKSVYVQIDDQLIDITQQPGVPYLVTPDDFSKQAEITIFSELDDTTKTVTGDQVVNL